MSVTASVGVGAAALDGGLYPGLNHIARLIHKYSRGVTQAITDACIFFHREPITLKLCRNASLSTLNISLAFAFFGRTVLLVFAVFALFNSITYFGFPDASTGATVELKLNSLNFLEYTNFLT